MNKHQELQLEELKKKARRDPSYAVHSSALGRTEKEFEEVLLDLPEHTQDVIWKYVLQCEDLSERMLRLVFLELTSG